MTFDDPTEVEQISQQMREADYPRGLDRARIDALANGSPPYSPKEVEENGIFINVNDLSLTRLAHDARMQSQNLSSPGTLFTCKTDQGPVHKRSRYGAIVTAEINKRIKRSLEYWECGRSKSAAKILHGIGPAAWQDDNAWCPEPLAIADLLIPDDTKLTFRDMPHFVICKSFTAPELIKWSRVKSDLRDPGWNVEAVNRCLKWIDEQCSQMFNSNFPSLWKPEASEERWKENSGSIYASNGVPRIDVFDFRYWSDEGGKDGWRRRIIIDTWSESGEDPVSGMDWAKGKWLYDSGDRIYAKKREHMFSCQFADLSAVSPFHYHNVRSLGFLLYAVCHMQNRLRCKFNEAVVEALTMYFRAKTEEEGQRILHQNFVSRGIIDNSIDFIKATDRFQPNAQLVGMGIAENTKLMEQNVASYRQNPDHSSDGIEKTKFQVMAELTATTQMVSGALQQGARYQEQEYREIVRRFTLKESKDPDVKEFQAACLRQGVPEDVLHNPAAWEVSIEMPSGDGNKSLELAIAQQFMAIRAAFEPDAQRKILYDVVLAMTGNAAKASDLVKDAPGPSDSVFAGQTAFGALMAGGQVEMPGNINRIEYVAALLANLEMVVKRTEETGGVPTMPELFGFESVVNHLMENAAIIESDPEQAELARAVNQKIGELTNLIKAFAQRLQEQQASQNGNGGMNGDVLAKIESAKMLAGAKIENQRETHSQKTAMKQVQFEQQLEQSAARTEQELTFNAQKAELEARIKILEAQLKAQTPTKL